MKIGNIEVFTPQHDKLDALNNENQVVGEFLEWLKTEYTLAKWDDTEYSSTLYPVYLHTEDVLAEYYEIDIDAFWKEKDAMLDAYRKQQEAINALDN